MKHLYRRTGYGCAKSPTGKHAANQFTTASSLESKCLYCAKLIERSSAKSKQWKAAA